MAVFAAVEWQVILTDVDAGKRTTVGEFFFSLLLPALFLVHGYALILFGLVAAVMLVAGGFSKARLIRLRVFFPVFLLVAYSAWAVLSIPSAPEAIAPDLAPAIKFQPLLDKLSLLVTPTLSTRFGVDIVVGLVLWGVAIVGLYRAVRRPGPQKVDACRDTTPFAIAAGVLFLVFLGLPHTIGWFAFVDARLLPLILLLAVLAYPATRFTDNFLDRWATPLVASGAAVIIGQTLIASVLFQKEARGFREVTAAIPPEIRLLYLPVEPDSRIFVAHPFIHYDNLALADRPIVTSDLWFQQGTALYPTQNNPVRRLPESYVASDLKQVSWPDYHLDDWDFVLIRTSPTSTGWPVPLRLILEYHTGGWWLYRISQGS
jgi:hypothetical protein